MTNRPSFWDILAWIVLGLILIWLILKTVGIIKTDLLLEYAPIYGAVYLAGYAMSTLIQATRDISGIKRNLNYLNKNFNEIDKSIEIIKTNCKKCK